MDQGTLDIENLCSKFTSSDEKAWIRAVVEKAKDGTQSLLYALIVVGLEPNLWKSENWIYEQCDFLAYVISAREFGRLLYHGELRGMSTGEVPLKVELSTSQITWLRRPSYEKYDGYQFPWPSEIFIPMLATNGFVSPPSGNLVGAEKTPSFPFFDAAFRAFFYGDYAPTYTGNNTLGRLSIRILDKRARIKSVRKLDEKLEVYLDCSKSQNAFLEFSSSEDRKFLPVSDSEDPFTFVPSIGDFPSVSWLWLKAGNDWIDFRSSEKWEEFRSRGLEVEVNEGTVKDVERISQNPTVSEVLYEKAISFTQKAISAYINLDYHEFFLFAGLAIELAIKSRLASECAIFLAPDRHFLSAFALWSSRDDAKKLPSGTRTISAIEAFDRLKTIYPSLTSLESGIKEIMLQRNGEAHLGVVDFTSQQRVFVAFLETINAVVINSTDFWAPHSDLVRVTLDTNARRINRDIQVKLSKARENFNTICNSLPKENLTFLRISRANLRDSVEIDQSVVECAICQSQAIATGINLLEYSDPDFGKDGEREGRARWLQFTPYSLKCNLCGLHLESIAELRAAGIPESWTNPSKDLVEEYIDHQVYLHYDYVPDDPGDDPDEEGW